MADIVLPCAALSKNLDFFTSPSIGFRVSLIRPADNPRMAVLKGHGLTLRLEQGPRNLPSDSGVSIRIPSSAELPLVAPNGVKILRADDPDPDTTIELPPARQSIIVTRAQNPEDGVHGRAGMRYTDLIPDRMGGAFIASHIAIPDGGPVNDYVHFHKIRFQIIYVHKGWVKVVYEDQGEPFVMNAGDCVIQPPQIRHRVLESSPGLEVIEIGGPAEHDTHGELTLTLPNTPAHPQNPDRTWDAQRFHFHRANATPVVDGVRDLGMHEASAGVFALHVIAFAQGGVRTIEHMGEMLFLFVLQGNGFSFEEVGVEVCRTVLKEGDSCVLPAGVKFVLHFEAASEVLQCVVPASRGVLN
ncbi:hypothetical protein BC830DRAFT_1234221 [Chytriomyces sp. MP71]|nr:hypothetical protein BC830DRAFT_1234221 [Chytriomyces sp. MP71]